MTADPFGDGSPDPFDDPASGDFINKELIAQLKGALLVCMPRDKRDHFPTSVTKPGQQSPAVQADVYVMDGPLAGREFVGGWLWQTMLVVALAPKVGTVVIGRLGQGEARGGNNAPWTLEKVTDPADRQKAAQWFAKWKAQHAAKPDPFADPSPVAAGSAF